MVVVLSISVSDKPVRKFLKRVAANSLTRYSEHSPVHPPNDIEYDPRHEDDQMGDGIPYNIKKPNPQDPDYLEWFWSKMSSGQQKLYMELHPSSVLSQMKQHKIIANSKNDDEKKAYHKKLADGIVKYIKTHKLEASVRDDLIKASAEHYYLADHLPEMAKTVNNEAGAHIYESSDSPLRNTSGIEVHTPPTTPEEAKENTAVASYGDIGRVNNNPESRTDSQTNFIEKTNELPPELKKNKENKLPVRPQSDTKTDTYIHPKDDSFKAKMMERVKVNQ